MNKIYLCILRQLKIIKMEIMKTTGKSGLIFLLFISFIMACGTKEAVPEPAPIDVEKVKQEIQAKENEFADTYNKREMKSIGYYADDAITFAQNSPALVGKPAIIEYLKSNADTTEHHNMISFKTNEVFVSNDGNQVVEIGYYKVIGSDSSLINSGNYMTLFVKRDGRYVSLRDMSACDIPLE